MSDAMANTIVRVKNGDPNQCEALRPGMGVQCTFKRVDGSRYCIMHGGQRTIAANRVKDLNHYRLKKYQGRVAELATSPHLRSVDEEIGILRMTLESVFEQCHSSVDLLLYSQKISDLVRDITKCVQVADKLATKSGMLIGRAEAIKIGEKIVDIISDYITDEQSLLEIAEKISDAMMTKVEGTDGSSIPALVDGRD